MPYIITFFIISLLIYLIYRSRSRIKRSYIKYKLSERRKKREKFDFEDEQQKRIVKVVERLIRDQDSRLYHYKNMDNYYIENGKISVLFNAKIVSIITDGVGNNSVMIFEAIFNELESKFNIRMKNDVTNFDNKIRSQIDDAIDFISKDLK